MVSVSCILDNGISYKKNLCSKVGIQKLEFYFFIDFSNFLDVRVVLKILTEMLQSV